MDIDSNCKSGPTTEIMVINTLTSLIAVAEVDNNMSPCDDANMFDMLMSPQVSQCVHPTNQPSHLP